MAHKDVEPVAKLGLSLASSLQVHSEANRRARQRLPELISLINSTALTLGKINDLIQENGDAFTKLCLEDITGLTATCEKIYIGILIMLVRQTENIIGDKEITEIPREETGKYLSCIAHTSVWRSVSWDFLELPLKYFCQWLMQAKFELMLRYLLGSIAQHQIHARTRVPGSVETEYTMRMLAQQMASRRAGHHRWWSKKLAKWSINPLPIPSANVSSQDIRSTCTVSSTPTVTPETSDTIDTKVENIEPEEVIPLVQTPALEPSKNTEVLPDATAETTSEPVQIDEKPIKEHNPSLLSTTRNWIKRILLPGSHDEWKDKDLEVWQIDLSVQFNGLSGKRVKRLELDDKHIRSALSQLTSKYKWGKRPELVEQYDSLDQRVRQRIDEAIDAAKRSSFRERTWIAMSITSPPFQHLTGRKSGAAVQAEASISLFFRLGDEIEPIYVVEPYSGRKFTFPYASCVTLKVVQDVLSKARWPEFLTSNNIKEGRYDICTDDGIVITLESWGSLRRPGMTLKIQHSSVPPPPAWTGFGPNLGKSRGGIRPATSTTDSSSISTSAPPTMKQIHVEMEELLRLSDSWSPDPETIGTGLGRLLGLWTNAIDPHVNVTEDTESEWSCSSEDSDNSSRDIAD